MLDITTALKAVQSCFEDSTVQAGAKCVGSLALDAAKSNPYTAFLVATTAAAAVAGTAYMCCGPKKAPTKMKKTS